MPHDLLRLARDYLESIGKSDELGGLRFFADDVIQVEFPNRLVPHGVTRDLAGLRDELQQFFAASVAFEPRRVEFQGWGGFDEAWETIRNADRRG